MRSLFYAILCCGVTLTSWSQFNAISWGGIIDGTDGNIFTERLLTDTDNNTFLSGYYIGVTEFGASPGALTHDCGVGKFVISKKLPNGTTDWILPFGQHSIHDFDIDSEGNVVVFAQINNSVNINFNGNTPVNVSASLLLAKYNSSGVLIWHQTCALIGGANFGKRGLLKMDQNDNFFIGGFFTTSIDLDFSTDVAILNQTGTQGDCYIAKYNSNGDYLWSKSIDASVSSPSLVDMDLNNNGDLFLLGVYIDGVTIDPSGSNVTLTVGAEPDNSETFIARFTSSGSLGFARTFENSDFDDFVGIQANNVNLHLFHNLDPTENLNPIPGSPFYSSSPGGILRLSASTATYFANYPVSQTGVTLTHGSVTPTNRFLVSGLYSGTRDFDPGAGTNSFTAVTGSDFFVSEFTSGYAYSDTRVLQPVSPSTGFKASKSVRTTNTSLGLAGIIRNQTVDLDYNAGTFFVTNTSGSDRNFMSYYSLNVPELNVADENGNQIKDGDVTPDTLNSTDFGDLCLNQHDTVTYVLKNTGLTSLTISSITVGGTNASDFSVPNIAISLISGGEITLDVIALANSAGIKNATITINNSDGDEGVYTFDIRSHVRDLPTTNYTITPNQTVFCSGDIVTFNGTGADTYQWNNGVSDGVSFAISSGGLYEVIGTNTFGCSDTNSVNITVNPLPNVTVSSNDPNDEICLNDAVQLIGAGADSYTYTGGVIDQTDFFPTTTDSYTVTGTDLNGCQNTASITITVNPLPNVTVSSNDPNDEICLNDAVQLIGAGADSYTYTGGVIDQTDFFPTTTDSYTVTGTDLNGCQNTASITITVNPLPNVTVSSNEVDDTICVNDSIQLIGAGALTYSYSGGVVDQVNFAPSSTTTYYITGQDANGCENQDSIVIYVELTPALDAGPDLFACFGDSVMLSAVGVGTITWSGGILNNSYFTPTISSEELISSTITAQGCTNSDTIVVTMGQQIDDALSTNVDTVFAASGYSNYDWYDCTSNTLVGSGAENWVEVGYDGDFYAVITDSQGCSVTTECVTVDFTKVLELSNLQLTVFPNPTTGKVSIQTDYMIVSIEVYDNSGRLILTESLSDNQVDLSEFARGTYLLKVITKDGQSALTRIVKSE